MSKYFHIILLLLAVGCGSRTTTGGLATLDLEAAIDNRQRFDLAEISDDIDFIPLEGNGKESFIGDIRKIEESKTGFYVLDKIWSTPVKLFDREGKFIGTSGAIGRGPNELLEISNIAVDYETDNLFMRVYDGWMALFAYDSDGRFSARVSLSLGNNDLAFHEGEIILLKSSPETIGTKAPLLELFSPDLQRKDTVYVVDKGPGMRIEEGKDSNGMIYILSRDSSPGILSGNGKTLIVKEERGDTLFYYKNGAIEPAYVLDFGNYAFPAGAFGMNSPVSPGDSYLVNSILEGDRYIFVGMHGFKNDAGVHLVFDKDDLSNGSNGKTGLFVDGIRFTPCYIRDNRLVGYISAADIADNAGLVTNPQLKTIAASVTDESNPIIAVAKLKGNGQ